MNYDHVLITGGAGFIGSQLVNSLRTKATKISILDDLSTGNEEAIPTDSHITFYNGSVLDEQLLNRLVPEVDVIFHLACHNLVKSVEDKKKDLEVNLLGTYTLLEKALMIGNKLKRFVYTSTASVYGDADRLPTTEVDYKISVPYAASKFSAEHYCQMFHRFHQLPVTVLRLSNVYGPGQLPSNPYCGVVAKFFEAIEKGRPLVIYGDGEQTRDFTYIDDALQAIQLASRQPKAIGEVFNIGTSVETKINQLAATIKEVHGVPAHPVQFVEKRTVDTVYRRCLANEKINDFLHWQPQTTLKEGITKTFKWKKEKS